MCYIPALKHPNANALTQRGAASMVMNHGLCALLLPHWRQAQDASMPTGGASKSRLADERGKDTGFHSPGPEPFIYEG